MLTLSKLRNIFEIPWGLSVCHRRNQSSLRETKWLTHSCAENDLHQADPFSRIDSSAAQKLTDSRLGIRFCILFALKAEGLRSRPILNLICDTITRNNWFSLYAEAIEQLRTSRVLLTSEAYRILLRTYVRLGRLEEAITVFCQMRELYCEFDAHTYNTIIKPLLQKEMYLLVFALYNLMIKLNCCPDDYTYSLLIDGFCKCGRSDEVIEILEDMDRSNIRPSMTAFTSILSGLCQGKKVDYAYRLFNKVKGNWFQPDLITYSVLLDGFCKLGRFDEALAMGQEIS
ncbi:pentatricopeptide repeat-containing protein At1g79540 [Neltuma alba]|uniref:pentatricopeptide repeat-containing protein At1g79540 n=1 Tax=Neltuma alba TaxID=207710 RepID=UPI0010A358ED|nr:pentatricopeptide repeat-containing protein At1g79540-like [Prosopis alba]